MPKGTTIPTNDPPNSDLPHTETLTHSCSNNEFLRRRDEQCVLLIYLTSLIHGKYSWGFVEFFDHSTCVAKVLLSQYSLPAHTQF